MLKVRNPTPLYLRSLFLLLAFSVLFQNCGEISLMRSSEDALPSIQATPTPQILPAWQTPTVTPAYCESINGNGDPFEKNRAEGMLCNFFTDPVKEYVLAPEMKYFLGFGLPGEPVLATKYFVQRAIGNSSHFQDKFGDFQAFQDQVNFKITYRLLKGSSEILEPYEKGAFYTVTAPSDEGEWEYQAQVENNYGASPVKTIKFKVQKAIYSVSPFNGDITCPGAGNTGVLDLTPFLGGRLVNKVAGPFGQNDIHIIKFKMPSKGYVRLFPSNGWQLWKLEYVVSTHPCDFVTGEGTYARQLGSDSYSLVFTNEFFQPGKTYYLNARHMPGDCPDGPEDDLDCPIFTDFNFANVDVSDKGKSAIYLNNMINGCYTSRYPWDPVAGKYNLDAALTTAYVGPGNGCMDPY